MPIVNDLTAPDGESQGRPLALLVLSSDTFPPTRVDVSILFGDELAGRGHRIDWILQSASHCPKSYVTDWGGGRAWVGATDLGTRLHNRVNKHLRALLHDLRVFSRAKNGSYDIIQAKDKFIGALFALSAARIFRRRFVYWLSWPFPEESLTRARDGTARYPFLYLVRGLIFKFLLYRILMPAADHVFVQSEQMRRDVASQGIPWSKMTAVPMGVRLAGLRKVTSPEHRRIPASERCFLYLGILAKVRRLDFLIRVLSRVRLQVPEAKLYFVGAGDDPSDQALLEAEANRLGLIDAIEFTGQRPWEEALQYVLEADVCVSPFYPIPILNSTSPTKLVEYMAMGRPVVANDHPEQKRLIEESGAGICVPWDEQAFAAAIAELLLNPELANNMGKRGPDFVAAHREYGMIAERVERELLRVAGAKAELDAGGAVGCDN